jgi:hypothetical protein
MAFHFMPPDDRGDGKHLKFWGVQTIYYALNVKARRAGKSPRSTDAYDLMGQLAGEEAQRLYDDIKKSDDVVAAYFEKVLTWCQDHIAKDD